MIRKGIKAYCTLPLKCGMIYILRIQSVESQSWQSSFLSNTKSISLRSCSKIVGSQSINIFKTRRLIKNKNHASAWCDKLLIKKKSTITKMWKNEISVSASSCLKTVWSPEAEQRNRESVPGARTSPEKPQGLSVTVFVLGTSIFHSPAVWRWEWPGRLETGMQYEDKYAGASPWMDL